MVPATQDRVVCSTTAMPISFCRLPSPLGPLLAGATAEGICLLEFEEKETLVDQRAKLEKLFKAPVAEDHNEQLECLEAELTDYFSGSLQVFSVPLICPGTVFQRRVWHQLLAIPYGETRSYEEVAAALGDPKAGRAVGQANGLNRIAILIPCHRVVNKSGQLGGYSAGLWRKRFLLDLEHANQSVPL